MPRHKLSADEANRAIGMIEAGRLQREVANFFQVSESVISRLVHRYRETENVTERPRSGRPRVTTPAQDRFLTVSIRRDPLSTCPDYATAAFKCFWCFGFN
ncbi:hypothetical protein ABEB36_013776 [Hypothenemus hampei]|uniref:Paired domain-containing protein n=1 Tax=Hypothenemus hampei TaxID=57062 RepID=A0ABD1E7Z5_HYPHA